MRLKNKNLMCILILISFITSIFFQPVFAATEKSSTNISNQKKILQKIISNTGTEETDPLGIVDARKYDLEGIKLYSQAVEKFRIISNDILKKDLTDYSEFISQESDIDFSAIISQYSPMVNPSLKIETCDALITKFNNELITQYNFNLHYNTNDELFEIKQKLTAYAYMYITSGKSNNEITEIFANALKNFLVADQILCQSNLDELKKIVGNITDSELKVKTIELQALAQKIKETGDKHVKKGLIIPPSVEYRISFNQSLNALNLNKYKAPIEKYTVTFNLNYEGATETPDLQIVYQGYSATEPAAPTRENYTFGGWYTDTACTVVYDFQNAISGNLTLYAKWTSIKKYTVSFNLNYDEATGQPASQRIGSDGLVTEPEKPTRDGYTFIGWYIDPACTTLFLFATDTINSDLTLYAGWALTSPDTLNIQAACNDLSITYGPGDYAGSVTQNLTLPSVLHGANITWTSSDSEVVSSAGIVIRPNLDNKTVILTASVSSGSYSIDKQFTLKVIKVNTRKIEDIHNNSIVDLQSLNANSDYDLNVTYNGDNTQVTSIDGTFSDINVESVEDALDSVYSVKSILGINNPQNELNWSVTNYDEDGVEYTFNQTYHGVSVYGRTVTICSDTNGKTISLYSGFLKSNLVTLSVNPTITSDNAKNIAVNSEGGDCHASTTPTVIIYSLGTYESAPVLAYEITVSGHNLNGEYVNENIFVNAVNGEIITSFTNIDLDESITGSGKNELNQKVTFPVEFKNWDLFFFYMMDISKNMAVYNNNLNNRVGSELNYWTDKTQISAYTNMISVFNWWKNTLNRKSVDNNGLAVKIIVHDPSLVNNAFWSAADLSMHFCDNSSGSSLTTTPAAALDVIAHEYTHGVVQFVTNNALSSPGAPKAIKEGYADIFGCFVDGNWTMGEDWMIARNIANPNSTRDAAALNDTYYYDYTTGPCDKSDDYGQCHSNSTLVSHAAYLMYKTYGLTYTQLEKLWYKSLSMGYDAKSNFYNVRDNVIKAAKALKWSKSDILKIRKAFTDVNIKADTGTLAGSIVKAIDNTIKINNANISVYQDGELVKTVTTDSNGMYSLYLETGSYNVVLSALGYINLNAEITISKNSVTTLDGKLVETKTNTGTISGTIFCATTGTAVSQAVLIVRSGWNTGDGNSVASGSTDNSGKYTFRLSPGYYTIKITKPGYTSGYINVTVSSDMDTTQNGNISPVLTSNQYRVVLTWGENPSDLDSHLVGTLKDGSSYHVDYGNKNGYNAAGQLVANLDIDDTTGYGPETVTFTADIDSTYRYYVNWYAGSGTWGSSNAKVEVYNGNNLIAIYNVPASATSSSGNWSVFEIHNGIMTTTNTINTINNIINMNTQKLK